MKLNKILSTTLLAGALCFTTNVNAEDFNFALKDLIDVNALGLADIGDEVISIRGFDIDPTYGPYFDNISVGGLVVSFSDFDTALKALLNTPDNQQLNFYGIKFTAGDAKGLLNELLNEFIDEPEVTSALNAQGITTQQITQLKTSTISQKVAFVETVQNAVQQEQQVKLLQKVALPVLNSAINQVGGAIDARSDMFNQTQAFGISSGAETGRGHGAWIKALGSKDDYKTEGTKLKAKSYSGVVGIDFKVMDELTIGLAGGYQQSEFDKQKIKFHNAIGSAYASYHFDNNIFTDVKYVFGRGAVTNKKNDLAFKAINTVHQGDAKVGYNILVQENTLLTPTIGVRYNFQKLKLKNDAFGNKVNARAKDGNYSHAIVTAKLAHKIDSERGALIPFVKVGYENLMSNKKVKVILTGKNTNQSATFKFDNTEKHTFLAGAGIGAVLNNVDLGAEYTFSKSKLYKGHTGTLNLRVNF